MKKYELTEETKIVYGHEIHRIRACADISDVAKAGDLGGWIESEANLSHEGDAWVYGDARVCGDAQVYGDARVYGDAWDKSPLYIQGSRWCVCMIDLNHIKIGCQNHSISDWLNHGIAIARRNRSDDIVPEYLWYVAIAAMRYGTKDERMKAMQLIAQQEKAPDAAATAIERRTNNPPLL